MNKYLYLVRATASSSGAEIGVLKFQVSERPKTFQVLDNNASHAVGYSVIKRDLINHFNRHNYQGNHVRVTRQIICTEDFIPDAKELVLESVNEFVKKLRISISNMDAHWNHVGFHEVFQENVVNFKY